MGTAFCISLASGTYKYKKKPVCFNHFGFFQYQCPKLRSSGGCYVWGNDYIIWSNGFITVLGSFKVFDAQNEFRTDLLGCSRFYWCRVSSTWGLQFISKTFNFSDVFMFHECLNEWGILNLLIWIAGLKKKRKRLKFDI